LLYFLVVSPAILVCAPIWLWWGSWRFKIVARQMFRGAPEDPLHPHRQSAGTQGGEDRNIEKLHPHRCSAGTHWWWRQWCWLDSQCLDQMLGWMTLVLMWLCYVHFLLLVGSCLHFIFFFDLFPFLPANFLGQSFHHCSLSLFTFHNSKHQTTWVSGFLGSQVESKWFHLRGPERLPESPLP
jgi:hypothetical protein